MQLADLVATPPTAHPQAIVAPYTLVRPCMHPRDALRMQGLLHGLRGDVDFASVCCLLDGEVDDLSDDGVALFLVVEQCIDAMLQYVHQLFMLLC